MKLAVSVNDGEVQLTSSQRVDQVSRTATFQDQTLSITLDKVRQGEYSSLTRGVNTSVSESVVGSVMGSQLSDKDSVTLNVKLFAVDDTRQKLIGFVNIPIDWRNQTV